MSHDQWAWNKKNKQTNVVVGSNAYFAFRLWGVHDTTCVHASIDDQTQCSTWCHYSVSPEGVLYTQRVFSSIFTSLVKQKKKNFNTRNLWRQVSFQEAAKSWYNFADLQLILIKFYKSDLFSTHDISDSFKFSNF